MKPLIQFCLFLAVIGIIFPTEVKIIGITSSTINTLANYTFQLDRTTDNTISQTYYKTQAVLTTSSVLLTFPSQYTSISSVTCLSISVDSIAISSFSCSITGNTVRFDGVFTGVSNLYVGIVQLMVGNIKNPSPAIYTGTFTGYIGSDYAVPVSTGVQLSPGYFTGCSITFTPGQVFNANSVMILSLTPNDPHPAGTTLTMQFPKSFWTNDISSTPLPISTTMACANYSVNINTGISCVGTASNNLITMSNIFSTTISSAFAIQVNNFLSPPSNQPSDGIVITSYVGTSKLDVCTVYPSGLQPNNFYNFTAFPLATMIVNRNVALRFNMILSMTISQSDYFSITFPSNSTFSYNTIIGTSYYILPPSISGSTVTIYPNTSINTQNYLQNSLYSLTFSNFQAPPSTLTTGAVSMQVLRNGYPIMIGSSTLTATNAQANFTITVANLVVWANTSYTFSLNTSNPLSSSGMIQVTLPPTVTISITSLSCATIIGTNLASSPICTVNLGSNSILISNINASSSTIPAQNGIRLTISGLINPPDTATTSSFAITTYYTSNQQGIVDVGSANGITSVVGTISASTVSVIPSSYVALQTGVSYNINFNNTYVIPINGYIVIQIPTSIGIVMASLSTYCKISINLGAQISTACSGITNSSFYQITFSAPALTQPITASSIISLKIQQLCTNPPNTQIVTPFAIFTYSSAAAIERLTTGITVQMTIPSSFNIISVSRGSQQNSGLSSYSFTLKQQAALVAGSILLITFPPEITMTANSTCTDLNSITLTCSLSSYQSLTVILSAVSSGAQFGVIVSNVRNPPSYRPTTNSFNFTTQTADQVSIYSYGVYSTSLSNSVPSIFSSISYSFNPGAYGSPESMTLSIIPSAYIVPSFFIINLASSFTINSLLCGSFIGFTGAYSVIGTSLNISGTLGSSQMTFTISGFTSPSYAPNDFSQISSFDSSGYLIDQNSNTVIYTLACTLPCKTCKSNGSACLSCYSNVNITYNILLYPVNNSCLVSCPSGYYSDPSQTCSQCSSTCLTCFGVVSNCTSCNSNSSYPALNMSSTGVCLSACPIYYYLSNTTFPTQCVGCIPPCLACSSSNSCLSCVNGFYYYNLTCSLSCPANITISDNSSWTCTPCSSQCATCITTVNTCSTCSSLAAFYNNQCVTQCPYPMVINNGYCANCSVSCKSCFLTYTNCTSCALGSAPYLFISSNIGSCMPSCPFTYYADSVNGICSLCSSLNISCTNCSSPSTCYNCDIGSGNIFYNNLCLSYVPLGYYNNSGTASKCNSQCSSCINIPSNCTGCVSLSLSNAQCVANCPAQTVSVNKICVVCTFPCLTCYNIPTNCTSCNSTASLPYYLSGGSCLQACPNYTYPNPANWVCSGCILPCQMCSTNASCTTCGNGFYLFNQTCSNSCPQGFVGLNKYCIACTNNCSTCLSSTSYCLSCIAGNYLYNSSSPTCSTSCPVGLFQNNVTQTCTGCISPCSFCSIMASNCTSCITGLLLNYQCVSNCSIGYFQSGSICYSCNNNCTSCNSLQICTSCISSLVLSGQSCVSSCPSSNPVINNARQCSSCLDPSCVTCNGSNYCFQCFYPTIFFQGVCLTSCPSNYQPNINYTNCIYSPTSANSTVASTLQSSLTSTSIFPVPFTIAAVFLAVACLMSKFQHSRTHLIGALYSLWGLLQWGSISFLLFYYWKLGGTLQQLSFLLTAGGLAWIYFMNLIFLLVQNVSLKNDKRLKMWLEGSVNNCWYSCLSFFCLFTSNKFKQILFSKLFNFRAFSAKLDSVGKLRNYYAFTFVSFLSSAATIGGSILFIIDSQMVINQLFMCYIDVLILSLIQLVLGFCNINNQADFFEDLDEDGLQINKRIDLRQDEPFQGVMPEFDKTSKKSYLYKPLDSAKKLQVQEYLSQLSSRKSLRDISIQAEEILGDRSRIRHLGTESISDLSLFEHQQDFSIQMDQIKERHDISVGQSVHFQDVSVNQTLHMHDISVNAQQLPSHHDVSIDQTRYLQEASVQFSKEGHQISIQFDQPQQHQISIQYVPVYTDQTVHMTKDQESLGIQAIADQQNISIQYSAKPIIEHMQEDLASQTSFSQQEPTDLQVQRRLVENTPAQQERGMKAELQLDIIEKLQRKKRELETLQEERRKREKQEAVAAFRKKISMKDESNDRIQNHGEERLQQKELNRLFQNETVNNSSEIHSKQLMEIPFGPSRQDQSQTHTQQQFIEMLSGKKIQDKKINNREGNKNKPNQNKSPQTKQKYMPFQNVDLTLSDNSHPMAKVEFEDANKAIEDFQEFIQDQDITANYELIANNTIQNQESVEKSRSTAQMTGRPPLPRGRHSNIIESSKNTIQKSYQQEEEIINRPLNSRMRGLAENNRFHQQEPIQHNDNKVNLAQFLQSKKRTLNSAQGLSRKNNLMEEDDALTRQIQYETRQRPLPNPVATAFKTEQSNSSIGKSRQFRKKQTKDQFKDLEFDNRDKIMLFNDHQQILYQAQHLEQRKKSKPQLPRTRSNKRLQSTEFVIQRPAERRGYLQNTFSSQEKRKSLEKIYLNKVVKK